MAIRTVNADNLVEYVAERKAGGSVINDAEVVTNAQAQVKVDGTATPGNPIIKEGVAETLADQPPDPGKLVPTAATRKGNPVQPRIDELTREKYELEEFAQNEYESRLRAERRIAELEAERPKVEVPKIEELKRPSPKDFTDQTAYDQAMDAYDKARDERTASKAAAAARQEAITAEQNRQLADRIEAAKSDLLDFQEVIERADKRTREDIPNHIKAAIVESEKGAYLAYYLAKNAEEEKRIFKLSPAKALMELGRIEDTFKPKVQVTSTTETPKPNGKPPEITQAPAPITAVRGEAGGIVNTDLSKPMPFTQYKQQRIDEMRKRRRH